ncbi:MAG: hypothetical protein RJQ09_21355 [Cyclobacteriaceae bacterium]
MKKFKFTPPAEEFKAIKDGTMNILYVPDINEASQELYDDEGKEILFDEVVVVNPKRKSDTIAFNHWHTNKVRHGHTAEFGDLLKIAFGYQHRLFIRPVTNEKADKPSPAKEVADAAN